MNYYAFHLGDYAVHTRHLGLLEDLAYRRMLDWYYLTEQALPNDPERIARLIGMTRHLAKVVAVLEDFFVETEQGYVSARCDKEIALYRGKAERAKSANKTRWGIADADTNEDAEHDADAIAGVTTLTNKTAKKNASVKRAVERSIVLEPQKHTQKNAQTENLAIENLKSDLTSETNQIATNNQEPITSNQEPKTNNQQQNTNTNTEKTWSPAAQARGGGLVYSDAFELAWQDYPARPGANKQQAYKAWNARLKAGVTATHLHAGVQRYRAYVQACQTEPRYIKQPATFFGPDEHFKADWSVQAPASAAMAATAARNSAHHGFEHIDYYQGVNADGSF